MTSSVENPTMDFREIDVLRFLFELNHQKMDPVKLQQIVLQHQLQNQMRRQSFPYSPVFNPQNNNISTPETTRINHSQIPEPKIVFQYVSSQHQFPTPSASPEPEFYTTNNDYEKAQKKAKSFQIEDRCNFIQLKHDQPQKILMTPTSSHPESDMSDHEYLDSNSRIPPLRLSTKAEKWEGISVYNNLPDIVMTEFDKILRESHQMKVEVVNTLNHAFPVSYEYNPKKSRIRTNYSDPHVADDRTRNNLASRRSRQRKKYLNHVNQYSVDFDKDENFLLRKQEKWLRQMITNLENKFIGSNLNEDMKLYKLRRQCGFD